MAGSTPVRVTIQGPQVPADRLSRADRGAGRSRDTYDRVVMRPAGGAIGRPLFEAVAAQVRAVNGWDRR